MDTITAIKSRRAVRSWTAQNVSDELLNTILEAGRFAPSPLNSQPWHFLVVKNKETMKTLTAQARHGKFLANANVIIIVTMEKAPGVDQWLTEHRQQIYCGACAMENMWLTACALDLGCCWVTIDETTSRQVFSIPQSQEILGCLAIGYPQEVPQDHKDSDRKPLKDIVSYEKFG